MQISTLGGFAVSVDGVPVDGRWRLRKAKTLVKVLALAPAHRIHRDVLGEQLWPDLEPEAIANNLHQALHSARSVLGQDRLVLRDGVVILGPNGDVIVDVDEFAAAAVAALSSGEVDELRRALEMWRGDLLPEDLYEDWAAGRREHVAGLRLAVAVKLADALVEQGAAADGVAILEPLALELPSHESVHRSLMSALVMAGRRLDGAGVYERLRVRLDEELGLMPEQETIDLYRRFFVGGVAQAKIPNNLPQLSTSFVECKGLLRDLEFALERTRLLTLTGPGGSGKTRLAIELAHRRAATGRDRDGVYLVELAGLGRGGGLVESAVAAALGVVRRHRGAPAALANQLAGRRIMLVIDNCEHVLDEILPITTELLKRCADVLIVATSREPLEISGELAWRVPSLELPPAQVDAPETIARLESVQLFVERARSVAPSFAIDRTNAAPIADICRRLDGIPLALELAAARVAHVSVTQLCDRLHDALGLLRRRRGRDLDRQQTMAATLDWSHDLLADDERIVFRRLAVFAGGFDLGAASYVCDVSEIIDPLGRLVNKSLVVADTTTGVAARYRLLEVIRQYALDHLDEAAETRACRERHCDWYTRQAESHDPDREKPVVLEPSPWFDIERDNLTAALSTAIEHNPSAALRLGTSTWRFFMSRGQIADGLRWLTSALDACAEQSATRANALFALSVLHLRRAEIERLPAFGRQILEICEATGDNETAALALGQQAILSLVAGNWAAALEQSSASVTRAAASPTVRARAAHIEGVVALATGDASRAGEVFAAALRALEGVPAESLPFFTVLNLSLVVNEGGPVPVLTAEETMLHGRRVGVEQARAYLIAAAALADRIGGRGALALEKLLESESRFARLGDDYGLAYAINQRAHTLRSLGSLDAAIAAFETAVELRRSLRDERAIAMSMSGHSLVQALRGKADIARNEAQEALRMMERSGDTVGYDILMGNNAAVLEVVLGNHAAAIPLLERSIEVSDRLGRQPSGWQHLLLAHLRLALDDRNGSEAAARVALERFEAFGDRRGIAALQSACKAGHVMLDVQPSI